MRLSKGLWQTYKEAPSDAEISSHKLMIRAGLIHKSGSGLYNYLPMGYRTIRKVEQIVREEMDKSDCHELLMSVVTPGELWQETGRWDKMGDLMLKIKDKKGSDLCLSPTNEEVITEIFRKSVKSYKQLPLTLYQINTKFRDEIRPRFGLMRGREFTMKDGYSFHMDKECLDKTYDILYKTYENIFNRIGLEFMAVEADGGAMADGESKTHEFQVIADSGEDSIVYSPEANYAANIEKAKTKRNNIDFIFPESDKIIVETPNKKTIDEVCSFLDVKLHHSLKSLIYKIVKADKEEFILLFLLGDDTLNELKLLSYLKADHIAAATDSEIEKLGLIKGFIGPDTSLKLQMLFDSSIELKASYVVGANECDKHIQNFCPQSELKDINCADLRLAQNGDKTWCEKGIVQLKRGIEVGHIFQLGDKYTKAMKATILDNNGKAATPLMGCYGIGITRIVAAAIEQSHDEKGIIWPKSIAPYQLYFAVIAKSPETKELAEKVYQDLLDAGIEVALDDRKAGAGFKFKDADLLGLPYLLVLGERNYKETGKLEIVERSTGEKTQIDEKDILSFLKARL